MLQGEQIWIDAAQVAGSVRVDEERHFPVLGKLQCPVDVFEPLLALGLGALARLDSRRGGHAGKRGEGDNEERMHCAWRVA